VEYLLLLIPAAGIVAAIILGRRKNEVRNTNKAGLSNKKEKNI